MAFVSLSGVNTPIQASFKLPACMTSAILKGSGEVNCELPPESQLQTLSWPSLSIKKYSIKLTASGGPG